jgi:hypothetical protein
MKFLLLGGECGGDRGDGVAVRLNLKFGLESPLNAPPHGITHWVAFVSGTGMYWQSCNSTSVPILRAKTTNYYFNQAKS